MARPLLENMRMAVARDADADSLVIAWLRCFHGHRRSRSTTTVEYLADDLLNGLPSTCPQGACPAQGVGPPGRDLRHGESQSRSRPGYNFIARRSRSASSSHFGVRGAKPRAMQLPSFEIVTPM